LLPGPRLRWTDSQGEGGLDWQEEEWHVVDLSRDGVSPWASGALRLNPSSINQIEVSSVTSYQNGLLLDATGEFLGWAPTQSFDQEGRQHVVFDRYRDEDFEVVYLPPERDVEQRLSASRAMEANAAIAVDPHNRVWVAWDEADSTWGSAGGLHLSRSLRLVMRDSAGWHEVGLPTQYQLTAHPSKGHEILEEFVERPVLAVEEDGTVWLFYRVVSGYMNSRVNANRRNAWVVRGIYLQGDQWSDPVTLPKSDSHSQASLAVFAAKGGGLWCAWTSDHRLENFGGSKPWSKSFMETPQLMLAHLQRSPADSEPKEAAPALTPWEVASVPFANPSKEQSIPELRHQKYLPLWGDLHRHSDLSRCASNLDGSVLDQYRYAQGPGNLDFVAVTDHFQHMSHDSWLYSMDLADRVQAHAAPIALYGFEYSFPEGHRNVIFALRNAVIDPTALSVEKPELGPFREQQILTIPHQIGDGPVSLSSSDFASDLDRQVEIFQRRGSYEMEGGFRQARRMSSTSNSVMQLLQDQLRFGLIASSDHSYSSAAFAVVLAEARTRESILEALRARRSYAATARIDLELQLGNLIMGEEGSVSAESQLQVSVKSPVPIARVEVVRNGEVAHRWEGTEFEGEELERGLLMLQFGVLPKNPDLELRGQGIAFGEPYLMDGEDLPDLESSMPKDWKSSTKLQYLSQRPQAQGGWVVPVQYSKDLESVQLSFGEPEEELMYSGAELWKGSSWVKKYQSKPLSIHMFSRPLGTLAMTGNYQPKDWHKGDWLYLRVIGIDGSMAWSSPIWIDEVKPE